MTICNKEYSFFCSKQKGINQWHICTCILNLRCIFEGLSFVKLLENQSKLMLTNHDNKNIPLCNNPAELLTWKHALCEEVRNWSLSLENNTRIIERQSFYLSESNETILFAKLCCLWSPREFELHFTIFYWFKSPTWHRKSNRACAEITGKPGKQQTWRLILRWRKCTRLSRKSGYFQHWLEYSSAFEVLEARKKLNIVLSSWETVEKCWTSLHESKLYVLWTLFMLDKLRYGKLIEPKTT